MYWVAAKTYGTPKIASRDALCALRLLLLETADYSIWVKHYNRSDPTAGWVHTHSIGLLRVPRLTLSGRFSGSEFEPIVRQIVIPKFSPI